MRNSKTFVNMTAGTSKSLLFILIPIALKPYFFDRGFRVISENRTYEDFEESLAQTKRLNPTDSFHGPSFREIFGAYCHVYFWNLKGYSFGEIVCIKEHTPKEVFPHFYYGSSVDISDCFTMAYHEKVVMYGSMEEVYKGIQLEIAQYKRNVLMTVHKHLITHTGNIICKVMLFEKGENKDTDKQHHSIPRRK